MDSTAGIAYCLNKLYMLSNMSLVAILSFTVTVHCQRSPAAGVQNSYFFPFQLHVRPGNSRKRDCMH